MRAEFFCLIYEAAENILRTRVKGERVFDLSSDVMCTFIRRYAEGWKAKTSLWKSIYLQCIYYTKNPSIPAKQEKFEESAVELRDTVGYDIIRNGAEMDMIRVLGGI